MKQVRRCVSILLVCVLMLTTSAFAATKASDQIVSYSIYATPIGNGKITIDFTIMATGIMKEIGAEDIYVYEVTSHGLEQKVHYDKEDPEMILTDTWRQAEDIIFYGEAGKEYYITVTIYAKDYNNQSDSRFKSFYVTAD